MNDVAASCTEYGQASRILHLDVLLWRLVLCYLPRAALRRAAATSRALRAMIDSDSFKCDLVDRIFHLPTLSAGSCFACLAPMEPWAIGISAYVSATQEEHLARTVESCHVVILAVAISTISKYFRYLAQIAMPDLQPRSSYERVSALMEIQSGSEGARVKAMLAERLLASDVEDLGSLVLPLCFAALKASVDALSPTDGATFQRESALFEAQDLPLHRVFDLASRFLAAVEFSVERLSLLTSLPHIARLMQFLERLAALECLARCTYFGDCDEVHDINESYQALVSGAWLERTLKVLRSRSKGRKWLASSRAADCYNNQGALKTHILWCRRLWSKVQTWSVTLPVIATFADNADHKHAAPFLRSLLMVSKLRLEEASLRNGPPGSDPISLDDFTPSVQDPRKAHPDRFSLQTALRLAEIDSEFCIQLASFDPS